MRSVVAGLAAFVAIVFVDRAPVALDLPQARYAVAEFGEPRYPEDFTHFDYVNPDAPQGGTLRIGTINPFDSLNFIPLQGVYPRNIDRLLYDTLMFEPQDELSVFYGLIAESVSYPEDLSLMTFTLRPEARWHDGTPITASDVAWTFNSIRDHARPFLRAVYEDVEEVTVLDDRQVQFTFRTTNTMTPLVRVAEMTVMPQHWWEAEGRNIAGGTLEPPLGSGAYRLVEVDAGRRLVYERVPDYWAADLPVRRGTFNFDRIEYDYFRDRDILFEAFRAGDYDFQRSFHSRQWATGYDVPAVEDGRLQRMEVEVQDFRGIQGFFMNIRQPIFADRRVREALMLLFNFEFINETVMYGLYERMESYFPGSEYAATGLPEGLELELLEPFRDALPPEVFSEPYSLPTNDGRRLSRENLRAALALFEEAGWTLRDGTLTNAETGEPFAFELLMRTGGLEPHAAAYVDTLRQAGITVTRRAVDGAQFQLRYQDRDFEMISFGYTFYPPPGNQLANRFHSAAASNNGSANIIGIEDPVVDSLLDVILQAEDLETKRAATRALDRVLLWGHYVVPHWHNTVAWIAYWNRFGFPETHPPYDYGYANEIAFQPTWWIDPDLDAQLEQAQ